MSPMENKFHSTIWHGLGVIFLAGSFMVSPALAIEVDLTSEPAKHLMASAREPIC